MRGTPQQIVEKYQTLARDKSTSGDRILAESYLQHAEHYMRIVTAAQAAQAVRRDDRDEDDAEDGDEGFRAERSDGREGRASDGRGDAPGREAGRDTGREPSREPARADATDGMAVLGGEDTSADLVAPRERSGEEADEGSRRRPRRAVRKPRSAEDDAEAAPRRRTRRTADDDAAPAPSGEQPELFAEGQDAPSDDDAAVRAAS